MKGIISAWGKILTGRQPNLSIEITRECPLTCPGCYAYGGDHLGGDVTLRELRDYKGPELVSGMLALLDRYRPLHVSIVGGEPLVRYRELNEILPRMAAMGIYTQLVTSAVRQIPLEWAKLRRLQIVVSIDGLQPEHDARRKPATYDRILKHIEGHQITVHCTVTRQQVRRDGYLDEFVRVLVGERGRVSAMDQPVHASGRRAVSRAADAIGSPARRRRSDAAPHAVSETAYAEGDDRILRHAAPLAEGLHLRVDDGVCVGKFQKRRSRPASSAEIPTARTAAALHQLRSPRSAATDFLAAFASARSSSVHFRSASA